ncbi:hypothetical protein ALQ94_102437 [Pseudomonas amygdali pv. morsprunorum]|uniref:Uncharacterized protein n=1 Tax=Pseudomonas amygdali pv. morsprunorum TaxID=129138 RepID=A0A3M2W9S0_PSEA0|nr:hypothetical protein ALQ94_102437 [Pseudomonas amygdali pv. morsprunorum]
MARTVYSAARREGKDVDTDRGDIHGDLHGYCCYQVLFVCRHTTLGRLFAALSDNVNGRMTTISNIHGDY